MTIVFCIPSRWRSRINWSTFRLHGWMTHDPAFVPDCDRVLLVSSIFTAIWRSGSMGCRRIGNQISIPSFQWMFSFLYLLSPSLLCSCSLQSRQLMLKLFVLLFNSVESLYKKEEVFLFESIRLSFSDTFAALINSVSNYLKKYFSWYLFFGAAFLWLFKRRSLSNRSKGRNSLT